MARRKYFDGKLPVEEGPRCIVWQILVQVHQVWPRSGKPVWLSVSKRVETGMLRAKRLDWPMGMMCAMFLLVVCLGFAQSVSAQGIFESAGSNRAQPSAMFQQTGMARGLAWGGSSSSDYGNLFGELILKGSYEVKQATLNTDVRFREGLFLGKRQTIVEIKEAYAGYQSRFFDVFLGNQIVKWGRTDGFNPTNNLNPHDYFLLTTDPDDQILGTFMLRTKIRLPGPVELELVALPVFKPSVYRYDLFSLGEGASFLDAVMPEHTIKNGSLAARLNVELPAMGFSCSYFNGFDPFYGFKLVNFNLSTQPIIEFQPDFYRKQSYGFDLALPLKKLVFRAELAYNATTGYAQNMHIPNPDLAYVAGFEFNHSDFTALIQYVGKRTFDFVPLVEPVLSDPFDPSALYRFAAETANYEANLYNRKIMNQQEEISQALLVTLAQSFGFDLLTLRLSAYYNLTSEEYFIRPEIKWKMSDAVALSLVGNWMKGPENSIFDHTGKILGGYGVSLTTYF